MADLVALADQMPTPIKVAWALCLAWSLVQVAWRRRAYVEVPTWQQAPYVRAERRRVGPAAEGLLNSAKAPNPEAQATCPDGELGSDAGQDREEASGEASHQA
jgi:hypothetical protein